MATGDFIKVDKMVNLKWPINNSNDSIYSNNQTYLNGFFFFDLLINFL